MTNKIRFTIYLPSKLDKQIDYLATLQGISRNELILQAVSHYFDFLDLKSYKPSCCLDDELPFE